MPIIPFGAVVRSDVLQIARAGTRLWKGVHPAFLLMHREECVRTILVGTKVAA